MSAIREGDGPVLASFGFDDLGRRTSLAHLNGTVTSYGHDAASRLTALGHELAGTAHDLTLTFGHNPAGQIASLTRSNDLYAWGGTDTNVATPADGLNRLVTLNGIALQYDARGNLTHDGTRAYGYSSENRLEVAGTSRFFFDPLGRIRGAGSAASTTPSTTYETFGDEMIAERGSSGAVFVRHVFGPGTDEPLVWYNGAGTTDRRHLHADERGSIVAVTDANGNALAVNRYDEYGRTATTSPLYQGRFGYTGQRPR